MKVIGGCKEANLSHAEAMIDQAATQGAEVIVLPKTMDLGWTHPSSHQEADLVPDGRRRVRGKDGSALAAHW
jgi:predicted amidohydrolase